MTNRCLFATDDTDEIRQFAKCHSYAVDGLVYHRGFAVKETPNLEAFLNLCLFYLLFSFGYFIFQGCDFILCCIIFFCLFQKMIIDII